MTVFAECAADLIGTEQRLLAETTTSFQQICFLAGVKAKNSVPFAFPAFFEKTLLAPTLLTECSIAPIGTSTFIDPVSQLDRIAITFASTGVQIYDVRGTLFSHGIMSFTWILTISCAFFLTACCWNALESVVF